MIARIKKIFSRKRHILQAVVVGFFTLLFFLGVSQYQVIYDIFTLFSFDDGRLWSSLAEVFTNSASVMSVFEFIIILALSLSVGVNNVLFILYVREYRSRVSFAGTQLSFFAMVVAIFGAGCLSCSLVFLAPIIALFGASTALWVVEYGYVLSLAGLLLVWFSNYLVLKKLCNPKVCNMD